MSALRILVVDDQDCFRAAARELLEWRGYEVVGEATTVDEALESARRLTPDGVLLDVQLGSADGHEVARALVELIPWVVILMVSASPEHGSEEQALQAGAAGFECKHELTSVNLRRYWS